MQVFSAARTRRLLAAAAIGALAAPLAVAGAATGASADTAAACPKPYPVGEVKAGMSAWGLTVSKGATPEKFTVEVQGVLKDGIAPGVDMIIAEAHSPAIDKAKAIWAGMSGSPVYAPDGRILGAVGYGFSGSSQLAGITPAAAMQDILTRPDQVKAMKAKTKVKLSAPVRRAVTSKGLVSAQQADGGLSALPVPRAVSGLSQRRIDTLNAALAKQGSAIRLYRAAAAAKRNAPTSEIVPGGNFGVLQAYGDVTQGGVGTTTMVCDGKALAFGHPYNQFPAGPVKLTAFSADAIAIVDDPVRSPYKMANFGGIVGTLTQDRGAGIAARLGAGPSAVPITATATADGRTRTGSSYVNQTQDVPAVSGYQLWAALDGARDKVGAGSMTMNWTIRGTAAGKPWQIVLGNRFASTTDTTFDSAGDIAAKLAALVDNPYTAVSFTDLKMTGQVNDTYGRYSVRRLLVKKGTMWVAQSPDKNLTVPAGKPVLVRAELAAYRAPTKTVEVQFTAPKKRGASGTLNFTGGQDLQLEGIDCLIAEPSECSDDLRSTSFPDLLKKVQAVPRNDALLGTLSLTEGAKVKITKRNRLDQIVAGTITIPLTIS